MHFGKVIVIFLNRIKSLDLKTLEESIGQPIQIAGNVKLQRSRTERFIEVFRDQVSQNPVYNGYVAAEVCIKRHCVANFNVYYFSSYLVFQ